MKLDGEYHFDAGVQDVWDALFDTAVLAAALPGCEKLEEVDGVLVGAMTIKIGPISGKFTGKVSFEDKVEPTGYKMTIDGRGPQGFVKATATIGLAADGDGTKITYAADAQIGGKLASVGQRLIDASARAITKQSLDNLHENIKIRAAAKPAPAVAVIPESEAVPFPRPGQRPMHIEETFPEAKPAPPVYKQAEASDMAKAVAKEVGKTFWPVIVGGLVLLALVIWLIAR
ncbi:MAG: carbon monoxide dehydrogenase subunit G [Kofleriaceae bacterium]